MITSTFIIATVAYIVFSLAFGLIWNEVVFKNQFRAMTSSISREKPIIPLGLLAIVIQAIAISILFSLFAKGANPIAEGLLFGLLLGSYSIVDDALVTRSTIPQTAAGGLFHLPPNPKTPEPEITFRPANTAIPQTRTAAPKNSQNEQHYHLKEARAICA